MIESVQVRQRGAFEFETHYDNLCALQDSCPLPAVKAHLSQGVLDLNGDRIRANDWMPILNTLRINKNLEFVAIRSYYTPSADDNEKKALIEKRKTPSVRSKEITYRLCKALKECLGVTPALTCLELQGLPLRERDLTTLMKGLVKNNTLSHFSLEYCRIGDAGLDILCKGIKNSASINSVNFTGCSLSWKGADSLAKVIKHQAMRRHNEAWRDSLRYRRPDLDRMPGIRRITINNNPMMGDQGAILLAEALKDDLWLKALDMQGNGISSAGAKALLDVLKYNTTLVVLDVRRNPLIDRDLVHAIMEQLMINCNGQDTEYKWIKAEEPVETGKGKTPKKRTKTLNSSFGRKTTIRITAGAARRRTKSAESVGVSRKMKPISSEGVKAGPGMPWRTAARANRYRGYPPEHIPGQSSILENSEHLSPSGTPNQTAVTVTMEGSEGSEEEEDEDTIGELQKMKLDDSALSTQINSQKNLRIELQQLRRQMQEERLARHKAEQRVVELTLDNKKLREENSRLRRTKGSILDDDNVLESIEASFKQFHEFLDLLRDAGLGQLITMAGLDAKGSPFQQPQSSKFGSDQSSGFSKPGVKSSGFTGGILGNNQINGSFVSSEKGINGNLRGKSYFNSNDPTMSSFLDDSNDNLKARHDDLYERILERTNGAFNQDVTMDVTVDSRTQEDEEFDDSRMNDNYKIPRKDEKHVKDKEIPDSKKLAVEESFESLRGPEGEIIMSLSPFDDTEEENQEKKTVNGKKKDTGPGRVDSPEKGRTSHISDYSYGMDSFEQSYVSERGEVVHLGDEMDFYPESPSPIHQASDEEDDF